MLRNPLPMGTQAAAGQSTPAMQQLMSMAYGGSRTKGSSRRRRKTAKKATKGRTRKRASKLKFGSKAWRAKYMKKRRK
jgi:hypothetical protein